MGSFFLLLIHPRRLFLGYILKMLCFYNQVDYRQFLNFCKPFINHFFDNLLVKVITISLLIIIFYNKTN